MFENNIIAEIFNPKTTIYPWLNTTWILIIKETVLLLNVLRKATGWDFLSPASTVNIFHTVAHFVSRARACSKRAGTLKSQGNEQGNTVTRNETVHRTPSVEGWRQVLPLKKRGERDIEKIREREREKQISRWPNVGGSERDRRKCIFKYWKDFLPID